MSFNVLVLEGLLWTCPQIRTFWISIQEEIFKLTGTKIPLNPLYYVLGADINIALLKGNQQLLRVLLYAARLSVLSKWIEDSPPDILLWLGKVMGLVPLERLSCVLQGTLAEFVETWRPLAPSMGDEWFRVLCIGVTENNS